MTVLDNPWPTQNPFDSIMNIITEDFIERILLLGPLAVARHRTVAGSTRPRAEAQPDKFTTWALVCEEILDTEQEDEWFDTVLAELRRRGYSYEQIDQMRRFAWRTAGWLNYDRVLWEWVHLDEADIRAALDLQLKEGLIAPRQHTQALAYLVEPTRGRTGLEP